VTLTRSAAVAVRNELRGEELADRRRAAPNGVPGRAIESREADVRRRFAGPLLQPQQGGRGPRSLLQAPNQLPEGTLALSVRHTRSAWEQFASDDHTRVWSNVVVVVVQSSVIAVLVVVQ
jgi:hypothetical protein